MATRKKKKAASKSGKRSRWNDMDMDAAVKDQEERDSRRGESQFHDLNQGWNFFYVMPPWRKGKGSLIWKEVQQHVWGLNCPSALSGGDKPCGICTELRRRMKRGDQDFTKKYRLSSRGLFNAIRKEDLKDADANTVKVLGTSAGVFNDIVDHVTDERVNIANPLKACVVGIKRKGKGMQTEYKVKVSTEPVDISDHLTDEILEGLFDLDAIRAAQPATTKEIRAELRGGSGGDDGDDDWDDDDDAMDDDDDSDSGEQDDDEDDLFDEPDDEDDADADEDSEDEDEDGDDGEEVEDDEDDEDLDEDEFADDEDEEEEEPAPPKKRTKKKTKKKVAKKKATKRRAARAGR